MKRDMSFTSQILLEMKSNEFWTSPWQQLWLINHYSARIYMHPDFMNPRLNLHFTEFSNRRSLVWILCDDTSTSPPSPPCDGRSFCPGSFCSWFAAPDWRDSPAEPWTRRGEDEEEKITLRKLSSKFHLQLRSRKNTKGPKQNIILGNSHRSTAGIYPGFS